MTKVEREHEPRSWAAWAVTRSDFAALVDEAAQIVNAETSGPTMLDIDVPGFERSFTTTAEFLENVTEKDWTGATTLGVTLRSGEFTDDLFGRLFVQLRIWKSNVTLRLSGRNRRSRNAIEPDLESLIAKHARQLRGHRRTYYLAVIPILIVQTTAMLGLGLALFALGLSTLPAWVIAGICSFLLANFGAGRLLRWTTRITQPVEFLPDSAVSTWDAAWKEKRRQAKFVGSAVVGIATVAAVVVELAK